MEVNSLALALHTVNDHRDVIIRMSGCHSGAVPVGLAFHSDPQEVFGVNFLSSCPYEIDIWRPRWYSGPAFDASVTLTNGY